MSEDEIILDEETLKRIEAEVEAQFADKEPELDEETLKRIEAEVEAQFADNNALSEKPEIDHEAPTQFDIPEEKLNEAVQAPFNEQETAYVQPEYIEPAPYFQEPPPQYQFQQPSQEYHQPQAEPEYEEAYENEAAPAQTKPQGRKGKTKLKLRKRRD